MSRLNDAEAPVTQPTVTRFDDVTGLIGTKTPRPVRNETDNNAFFQAPSWRHFASTPTAERWLWTEASSSVFGPRGTVRNTLLGRSDWNERDVGEWDVAAVYTDENVYVRRLTTREQVHVHIGLEHEIVRPHATKVGATYTISKVRRAVLIALELLFPEQFVTDLTREVAEIQRNRAVYDDFELSNRITTALGLSSWMRAEWPVGCLMRWLGNPVSASFDGRVSVMSWRVRSGSTYREVGVPEWTAFQGAAETQARFAMQATDRVDKANRTGPVPLFALCLRDDASVAWLTERVTRLGLWVRQAPSGGWVVTGRINLAKTAGVKLKGYAYEAATTDVLEVDDVKGRAIARAVYSAAEAMRAAVDLNERRGIAKSMGLLAKGRAAG